jgi:hypothetical protein
VAPLNYTTAPSTPGARFKKPRASEHVLNCVALAKPTVAFPSISSVVKIKLLLPPYRIIGQLRTMRRTLTYNFSQENIRYNI